MLRRAQRLERHRSPGDQCDVGAFAQLEADIKRQCLPVVRDFLLDQPVQAHRFEKHDRVRVADRCKQQSICARRGRRTYDSYPRMVRQQSFQALGVMFRCVDAAAVRHTHHERTCQASTRPIAHAGHVVADLIQRGVQEAHELDFGDGA